MWVTLLVTSTAAYFGGLKPGQQCTGQNLVVLTNIGLGITKSQNVVRPGVNFSYILQTIHKALLLTITR